uniref:Uncharacterized protein n=1 Tax=Bactrocera dorsalis TaxID=27457 RepID=A0A034VMI4_BACDO
MYIYIKFFTHKLSESSNSTTTIQAPSALLTQRRATTIGNIPPPGSVSSTSTQGSTHSHSSLTQANLARINTANEQNCHQGKVALHQTLKKTPITQSHHQPPESVADASYYSSVLNSFGSNDVEQSGGGSGNITSTSQTNCAATQNTWQSNQYYR